MKEQVEIAQLETEWGVVYALFTVKGLCWLGESNTAGKQWAKAHLANPSFSEAKQEKREQLFSQIKTFLNGTCDSFSIPYDLRGTTFQQSVWQALLTIPYGQTQTYAAVAKYIHKPRAVRAVGSACRKNPLPLVIPCHRVISSRGIGNYSGVLKSKKELLQLEAISCTCR
ncbi:methylated-DNA--[protein]-cysteine S-methyltransferase [Candidatus Roizmanbacteria bacterium]|nr:methylated-DNA--[protein]-cysteine S-methyltransferase [Candidatus Roizmanbacteria bacterium]